MFPRHTRVLLAATASSVIAFAASPAFAQDPAAPAGPSGAPAAAPGAASAEPTERARLHYERGLQLFNEENYDAALFEFERAYELAPSYKILYNMGRIQRQQNNYAAAMRSYARYLREGGAAVPEERRKEVENEIAILKPRVAHIKVSVNVDGADVYSDDTPVCTATIESSCVGKSPLATPILVNGGRHKITATKQGYAPATSLVSVVGSDEVDVKLDLVSYERPPAPPKNPWVIPTVVGWSVTGVVFVTSAVTGVLAKNASSDQKALDGTFGVSRADLDDAKSKTRKLANITDGLLIGGAVTAVASSYFTLRAVQWKGESSNMKVEVGLNRVGVAGQF